MDTNPPVLNPVIASSTNPTQVANTVKGVLLSVSGIIVFFLTNALHVSINPSDVTTLIEATSMIAGGIWAVYGLLHKGVATLGRVR